MRFGSPPWESEMQRIFRHTVIVVFQGVQLGGRLDGLGDRLDEVEDVRLPGLEAQG